VVGRATVASRVRVVGTRAGRGTLGVLALREVGLVVAELGVVRRLHAVDSLLLGVEVGLETSVHGLLMLRHERLCVHHSRAVSSTVTTTGRAGHGGARLELGGLGRHVRTVATLVRKRAVALSRRVGVVATRSETTTTAIARHKVTAHAGVAVL